MAVFAGPEIVNDGLVLHLDTAGSKSFPGPLGDELVSNSILNIENENTVNVTYLNPIDICTVEAGAYYLVEYGPVTFNVFAPGMFTIDGVNLNVSPFFFRIIQYQGRFRWYMLAETSGTLRIEAAAEVSDFDIGFVSVRKILNNDMTNWFDLSGNGYDAELINSAIWYPVLSEANYPLEPIWFNLLNSESYIQCPEISELSGLSGFTVSTWFNKINASGSTGFLLTNGDLVGSTIFLSAESEDRYVLIVKNSGSNDYDYAVSSVMSGFQWVNITATWSSSNSVNMYINGNLDGSSFSEYKITTLNNTVNNLRINGDVNGNGKFAGSCAISELKIYDRELSAAEVKQNFEATRNRYGI